MSSSAGAFGLLSRTWEALSSPEKELVGSQNDHEGVRSPLRTQTSPDDSTHAARRELFRESLETRRDARHCRAADSASPDRQAPKSPQPKKQGTSREQESVKTQTGFAELKTYLDGQFSSLSAQMAAFTLRQADRERRLTSIESALAKIEASPSLCTPPPPDVRAATADLQEQLQSRMQEIQAEAEERVVRVNNAIIVGLAEEETPSLGGVNGVNGVVVPKQLMAALSVSEDAVISCRRLGRPRRGSGSKPRPVLVTFRSRHDKAATFRNKNQLKDSRYNRVFVDDDLTRAERDRRSKLVPLLKQLRAKQVRCSLRRDKLFHEGRSMTIREAESLLERVSIPMDAEPPQQN